ncbi:hypothetical protein B0J18DRAFT_194507 [Chaetomium sp. MPI-SDFR-AT-0129]|nr:hypothetical protein B0J18DRAFT_194507 [Chaetomium sp. MPI-SDFR-AT-0129]
MTQPVSRPQAGWSGLLGDHPATGPRRNTTIQSRSRCDLLGSPLFSPQNKRLLVENFFLGHTPPLSTQRPPPPQQLAKQNVNRSPVLIPSFRPCLNSALGAGSSPGQHDPDCIRVGCIRAGGGDRIADDGNRDGFLMSEERAPPGRVRAPSPHGQAWFVPNKAQREGGTRGWGWRLGHKGRTWNQQICNRRAFTLRLLERGPIITAAVVPSPAGSRTTSPLHRHVPQPDLLSDCHPPSWPGPMMPIHPQAALRRNGTCWWLNGVLRETERDATSEPSLVSPRPPRLRG